MAAAVIAVVVILWLGILRASRARNRSSPQPILPLLAGLVFAAWLALTIWLGAEGVFRSEPDDAFPLMGLGIVPPSGMSSVSPI